MQTTSLDYKIVSATGLSNPSELNDIRNKNNKYWQTSTPKNQVKIEIAFKPSQLQRVEISTKSFLKFRIQKLI